MAPSRRRPEHERLGLDLLALRLGLARGRRRQQGEQAALVPVDQRARPVDVHRGAGLLEEAAHQPRVGDDAALGVRVLELADEGDAAAGQVGAEVAGAPHERLAADDLAGHELLDQVAAQPRLGLGAHLLAGPLERDRLGQLAEHGLLGGRERRRAPRRPARR